MKNKIMLFLMASGVILGAAPAMAQNACFLDEKNALKTCVDDSLDICRDSSAACNPYEPVLSIDDVRRIAINACCRRENREKRRNCFKRERRKYIGRVRSGPQAVFFRAARRAVKDVQRNICNDSTYTLPPDASLF